MNQTETVLEIDVSDEKVLTKEIAEQFLADEDSVDLSEFTAIEDDAAEVLSGYEGWAFMLDGISELSVAAAESLSKCESYLSLAGLRNITDAVAERLCSGKLQEINLDGVTDITDDAILLLASALENVEGTFGRDTAIPKTIPNNIKDFRLAQLLTHNEELGISYLSHPPTGRCSRVAGAIREVGPLIGDLTLSEAENLAEFKDVDVCLTYWYSVASPAILKALSLGQFKYINLRLDEVTVEIAEILAGFRSHALGIDPLSMGEEAASVLSEATPKLEVNLTHLPEEVREILRESPSMADWGQLEGPFIRVCCSMCGEKAELELSDIAAGEAYENTTSCLEREGWSYDEYTTLCNNCSEDED